MDTSKLKGKDFEFLITPSDIKIKAEEFDNVMTPNSISWTKTVRNNWIYYQVGNDEFSYSWEMPGVQMSFNENMSYDKAKKIADEVVDKLRGYTNREINLLFIPKDLIIKVE